MHRSTHAPRGGTTAARGRTTRVFPALIIIIIIVTIMMLTTTHQVFPAFTSPRAAPAGLAHGMYRSTCRWLIHFF